MKYSDQFMDWLVELGYTHCFFVGGGNVMHLLESASHRFKCIPVVHEVAAGIAAEYFNETSKDGSRAFALVTAGPGLTNIVTAIAGAYLESRELLVIGGQAKTSDLSRGTVPQIGHQEIDGVGIVRPITVQSVLADRRLSRSEVFRAVTKTRTDRKGPVFIEMCIDVSAMPAITSTDNKFGEIVQNSAPDSRTISEIRKRWEKASRPIVLLGGGFSRIEGAKLVEELMRQRIPLATTWNGFDRVPSDYSEYCGRPNTYGMRWSNILIQSSDFVLVLGSRLGIQQIGFAWEDFVPNGFIVQVDIDTQEIEKDFPRVDLGVVGNAKATLEALILGWSPPVISDEWRDFIHNLRAEFYKSDTANLARKDFVELHKFVYELGDCLNGTDLVIPCSSGGTFNAVMQVFRQKYGQTVVTNKGLASMGYGLSGAIGAALANPSKRVILLEGDGGFAQNLQELGTLEVNQLNVKVFLTSNKGYASIRTTQKSYFNGNYVGCDRDTGLGLPDWKLIASAFGIEVMEINRNNLWSKEMQSLMENSRPVIFVINLDPEQLFYPKVTSRVLDDGSMKTNPIHVMSPPLDVTQMENYFKYIPRDKWYQ